MPNTNKFDFGDLERISPSDGEFGSPVYRVILRMLSQRKSLKEIAKFFNVTTKRVIEILKGFKLARSSKDLTEKDRKTIESLAEKASECIVASPNEEKSIKDNVFILTNYITGERYAVALIEGKIEYQPLSHWLSHSILERLIVSDCDLETIKKITYGDMKLLEENYRIVSANVRARKKMVDS